MDQKERAGHLAQIAHLRKELENSFPAPVAVPLPVVEDSQEVVVLKEILRAMKSDALTHNGNFLGMQSHVTGVNKWLEYLSDEVAIIVEAAKLSNGHAAKTNAWLHAFAVEFQKMHKKKNVHSQTCTPTKKKKKRQ